MDGRECVKEVASEDVPRGYVSRGCQGCMSGCVKRVAPLFVDIGRHKIQTHLFTVGFPDFERSIVSEFHLGIIGV